MILAGDIPGALARLVESRDAFAAVCRQAAEEDPEQIAFDAGSMRLLFVGTLARRARATLARMDRRLAALGGMDVSPRRRPRRPRRGRRAGRGRRR
jgi:hypothetical protein